MLMQLATLAGALLVGLAAIALVYLLGMRAKSPLVLRLPSSGSSARSSTRSRCDRRARPERTRP